MHDIQVANTLFINVHWLYMLYIMYISFAVTVFCCFFDKIMLELFVIGFYIAVAYIYFKIIYIHTRLI